MGNFGEEYKRKFRIVDTLMEEREWDSYCLIIVS